jgi:polysaccharide biosynthesis PFTS motif protein
MKIKDVVIESPTLWHKWLISLYLRLGHKVWIVEPFHAYHHEEKGRARFYPRSLPDYIQQLLNAKKVSLLEAVRLNPKDIYPKAADRAVESVGSVFPLFRNKYSKTIGHVCATLHSPKADQMFRKELCDQLGKFYSINILLQRLGAIFPAGLVFYPESNVSSYLFYKDLARRSGQLVEGQQSITLPRACYYFGVLANLKRNTSALSRLVLQTLASGLFMLNKSPTCPKKEYNFAIAILGDRQLRNNQRRADFIVDGKKILEKDVVFIPLIPLNSGQQSQLGKLKGEVFYPPSLKRNFSHSLAWLKLLMITLKENLLGNYAVIDISCRAMAEYYRWETVLKSINFNNFITQSDFGGAHIARDLALKKSGVKTWYLTDSMNSGAFSDEATGLLGLHPFWTYLNYDHLVSWSAFMSRFYSRHPSSFGQVHEVGCLWAGHIRGKEPAQDNKCIVAAFDTTYTRNSFTSYNEGIAFAKDIYRLVQEFPEMILLLKEKKASDAGYHAKLDPVLSPILLALYETMYKHDRVRQCSNQTDAAEVMSSADIIISFPYTSTTFEALSANKPAIWHDPLGYYRQTPYAKLGGLTTHNYDELKKKVVEFMSVKTSMSENIKRQDSQLLDPFCDGKAIERFRDLLIAQSKGTD